MREIKFYFESEVWAFDLRYILSNFSFGFDNKLFRSRFSSFFRWKKGSDTPESIKQKRTCSWEDSRDTWHRFGNAWYNLSRNSNHVCFPNVLFSYLIFRSKCEGNYEKIWTKLIFCNLKSIKKRWKSGHWGKAREILRK